MTSEESILWGMYLDDPRESVYSPNLTSPSPRRSPTEVSDHEECDDEDEGDIGVRALAYDPNQLSNSCGLPVNGHDFLKMVQEERSKLPGTVSMRAPILSKKSTPGEQIVAMEVFQPGEQSSPPNLQSHGQENGHATQQSSVHPMETSQPCDTRSPAYIDSSSDEEDEEGGQSQYSSMASKEFRNMIRLKSLGCTPLDMKKGPVKRPAPCSPAASQTSDLLHRDKILANFLKLRQQIDTFRQTKREVDSEAGNARGGQHVEREEVQAAHTGNEDKMVEGDHEKAPDKMSRRMDKNLSRSERRAAGLMKLMNLGHAPQLSELAHKSQMVVHLTLDKMVEQCDKAPIYSTLHADWIYSLIALLRDPIEPEICATLRQLAKVCMARRDSYERRASLAAATAAPAPGGDSSSSDLVEAINKEEYYGCLLIICLVRFHFGQADLK